MALEHFGSRVAFAEPMSRHTWLRVGGPADALVQPENAQQLIEAGYMVMGKRAALSDHR